MLRIVVTVSDIGPYRAAHEAENSPYVKLTVPVCQSRELDLSLDLSAAHSSSGRT